MTEKTTHYAIYKPNSSELIGVVGNKNLSQAINYFGPGKYKLLPTTSNQAKELIGELNDKKDLTKYLRRTDFISDKEVFSNTAVT